jgi:parallel beta helix pectate lyase-like protein
VTTFTITDCSNDRQLQDAISSATDGDTIIFACSGTITLTSTLTIKAKGLSAVGPTLDGNGEVVVLDGGKQMGVLLVEDTPLVLKGLAISNGKAERGGGLFNSRGKVSITNCTFSGNQAAKSGGGLFNEEGEVSISHCIFSGNAVEHGGGLFNRGGKVTITNCTFSGNEATGSGGGLFNNQKGEVNIGQCTFSDNTAQHGGGLANEGRLSITNCTIAGNTAGGWGGGFSNNFGSDVSISHSTIVNNTASVAGGLHTGYPPLHMGSTIVANNTAKFVPRQNGCRDVISFGYNLESGDDCFSAFTRTDQFNLDPTLDPTGLQNNGGPTQTIALQAGSPAIGAVTEDIFCPDTDQRGWLRPPGITSCDSGAYQSSYLAPPAPPSP